METLALMFVGFVVFCLAALIMFVNKLFVDDRTTKGIVGCGALLLAMAGVVIGMLPILIALFSG